MGGFLVLPIVAVAGFATMAQAQQPNFDGVSACAQTCVTNLLAMAASFNCPANNLSCVCGNGDFVAGYSDCASKSCPANEYQAALEALSDPICASAPKFSLTASGSATRTPSGTAAPSSSAASSVATASSSPSPTSSPASSPAASSATPSESSTTAAASSATSGSPSGSPTSSNAPSGSVGAAGASASPSDEAAITSNSSSGPNLKVILPAVLCSVFGVLIIALVAFFIFRKRKNRRPPIPRLNSRPDEGNNPDNFQAVAYEETNREQAIGTALSDRSIDEKDPRLRLGPSPHSWTRRSSALQP